MSNFPLSYKLSWLPRLLKPSLAGNTDDFGPMEQRWLAAGPAVRLVFLGDISAIANRDLPEIDPILLDVIAGADLVVANCESPVVERPSFPLATRLQLRHAMTPAFLDGVLAAAGISPQKLVLSLANNHLLDQGVAGFDETVARLAERGIRTIGTVADGLLRRAEVGPLTIGLLAFTQWRNAGAAEFVGRVIMADGIAGWPEQAGGVDLVCAVPHCDLEFRHFPGQETRALARSLAGAGAGLIVGGHAHVVQPVERIGDALVAYGLGDFLGTVFSRTPWQLRIGAMLSVEIAAEDATKGRVAAYRVVPFVRKQHGRHERLVAVEGGDEKTTDRLGRIFTRDGMLGSGGAEVR